MCCFDELDCLECDLAIYCISTYVTMDADMFYQFEQAWKSLKSALVCTWQKNQLLPKLKAHLAHPQVLRSREYFSEP